jgi:hypothetical protein
MSIIPALKRLSQEDYEFNANLSYMVRLCLKNRLKKMSISILRNFALTINYPKCGENPSEILFLF